MHVTRRVLLLAGVAAASPASPRAQAPDGIAGLERELGGRIGWCVLDGATGRLLQAWRADERFAMCSTFKLPLAAAVLARVDAGGLRLDQPVRIGARDMIAHAPVTQGHVAAGSITVETLCAAAVELSDNPAANLLLKLIGGPRGFTAFLRAQGDATTRLDRSEPALNENSPGDPRDTTSATAMARTLRALLLGDALSAPSRERLVGWARRSPTGLRRLRAAWPDDWQAGDKTGTGSRGAVNDVAIAWPPGRAPVVVCCYLSGSTLPRERLDAAHARLARLVRPV